MQKYTMPKKEAIEEHKRIVKELKHPKALELKVEAKKQAKELAKMMK